MWEIEILGFTIYQLFYYFMIYSILGWTMETILVSSKEKHFVNRGFLNGPLCPIYGFGMCLIIMVLTPYQDRLTDVFLGGMLLATALEYFTSWLLEKLFHTQWWNYDDHRFNLHGRVCLDISLAWGVLSLVIMKIVQPFVAALVDYIPYTYGKILAVALLVYLIGDMIVSVYSALKLANKLMSFEKIRADLQSAYEQSHLAETLGDWKERFADSRLSEVLNELTERSKEWPERTGKNLKQFRVQLEEIKKRYHMGERLHVLGGKRLTKAFPHLRVSDLVERIEKYKEEKKSK
ncbi:MAG TPA: putative ABC transporter permease [Firmicutes bacterium]|nr:putative ABC transporter permease [Bacillota bacterium]